MKKNKPTVAIVTESLRRDNQKPLQYFSRINHIHLYQSAPYGNETKKDLEGAVKFSSAFDLYKKIVSLNPDVIQGPEPFGSKKMFIFSLVSYIASKKLNIPLIFPFWENRPAESRFGIFQREIVLYFSRIYCKHASKIIYINQGALKNIKKLGITNFSKLTHILWGTWGVDTNEFKPDFSKKQKNTILYVGRFDPEKGIKYLLQAFKKVSQRFVDSKLILIGSGKMQVYIQDFIKKNKLQKNIELVGPVENYKLPAYYQRASLFASPAITTDKWEEQVGMTAIQAMACGTPVISTNSGAIPEYVPNKIAGLIVRQKDSDRLASAMITLLDNNSLRKKISVSAANYAKKHYDAKTNIKKAEDVILEVYNHENKK